MCFTYLILLPPFCAHVSSILFKGIYPLCAILYNLQYLHAAHVHSVFSSSLSLCYSSSPSPTHRWRHTRACMHTQSHVLLVSDRDSHRWTAQSYTYTIVTAHMVYSIHMPLHIHIDLHTRSDTKVCHLECVWNLLKCKKRQTITNKHTLY